MGNQFYNLFVIKKKEGKSCENEGRETFSKRRKACEQEKWEAETTVG